ncbi:MAG: HypC/HybG/HupF family hydrogenase formation chaperone [Candidatus Heimdallarchaeota archaeon]|nr:HypC/HybG/HupF family hydrogenase formation chaperone [Candidatus Heimdallarchaeota archaeon]
MCVAIPLKIISIEGTQAVVDLGDDKTTIVDIAMVEVEVGDYVIVNTGFAVRMMDEEEAIETIELWKKYQEKMA